MAEKSTKRRRQVERIEDWDDARYSHVPPRAALDARLTEAHFRVLVLIGKVNTLHGWCQLSQTIAADLFGMKRQTVNGAVSDLVTWGYVERRTQKQTRTSFCHYRVLIDQPEGVSSTDDTPPNEGVSSTGDTPPEEGVSSKNDTGVSAGNDTGVGSGRHPPIYNDLAREIRDQRSPPKSPNGGPKEQPVDGKWKDGALAELRVAGKHRDAVENLIAPLLASDKRLSLGKGAERVEALAELAQAAHGLPRPAVQAALKRMLDNPQKLTPRAIRAEIDAARRGGAMIPIRPGTPQWSRWLEHFASVDPRQAETMRRVDVWQVSSEWPPAIGKDAA